LLVTDWAGNKLAVWDAQTGQLIRTIAPLAYKAEPLFKGDDRLLMVPEGALAMAFAADSGKFHVLTENGLLRACDLSTGKWSEPLARVTLLPANKYGERLASGFASPDGTHFAYVTPVERFAREANRLEVLVVGRREPLPALDREQLGAWRVRQFSADNKLVGIAPKGATVTVNWDVAGGGPTTTLAMPGVKFTPLTVVRSPDGRTAAVVFAPWARGRDDSIDPRDNWPLVVFDTGTGREQYRVPGWKGYLAGYTRDGTKLVSLNRDEILLADAATGEVTDRLKGHATEWIDNFAFSADGKRFATCGGRDRSVIVWDLTTGKPALDFDAPRGPVQTIVFSPDGKTVFTSSTQENTGWLWDAETGQRKHRLVVDGKGKPQTAAFTPDGKYVVIGYGYGLASGTGPGFQARLWRVRDGKMVHEFGGHTDGVLTVAVSPDGKQLATRDRTGGKVRLWELHTGRFIREIASANRSDAMFMYAPDGELFSIVVDRQGGCETRDLLSGQLVARWTVTGGGYGSAVSPDGRLLASREGGRPYVERVVIRRVATGEKLCDLPLEHVTQLSPIAFSHDGTRVAVAGVGYTYHGEDTVYLFDTATGRQLRTIRGHWGRICSLAFSPDGTRLATGSWDTTVLIWDLTKKP
jgi:WD40 repeat protein